MAYTQAQLNTLQNAIASGVKEVTYGDKKTVYQDLSEMIALANLMQTEINGIGTIAQRRRQGIFKSTIYNHGRR